MHPNAPVSEGIPHPILITVIHPTDNEHPLVGEPNVTLRVTKELACCMSSEGTRKVEEGGVKRVRFG